MKKLISTIWHDTMKTRDGIYSRISIIMASAWALAFFMAIYDFCVEGFRMDVWSLLVGIAIGSKFVNAHSEAVNPTQKQNTGV